MGREREEERRKGRGGWEGLVTAIVGDVTVALLCVRTHTHTYIYVCISLSDASPVAGGSWPRSALSPLPPVPVQVPVPPVPVQVPPVPGAPGSSPGSSPGAAAW